jgi:uncharacterized protein (TIGR03083 family)
MADMTNEALVDAYEDVLTNTIELARGISDDQAGAPTDCPGWTIHDQLSHMVGLEQILGGSPRPSIAAPDLPHVHGDVGAFMETIVHVRRELPFSAVVDELTGLLPRRLAQLRAAAAEGDPEVMGPMGPRKLSAVMTNRVFDLWAHEQDIRRALGLAPRLDCAAAHVAVDRTLIAWESMLPAAAGDVNGRLDVSVTRPHAATRSYVFGEGGGTARLVGDVGAITWLGCGRGNPAQLGETVTFDGDAGVLAAVGPALGFTP